MKKVQDFFDRYDICFKVLFLILLAILAVSKWYGYFQTDNDDLRFGAILWTTMFLFKTGDLLYVLKVRNKITENNQYQNFTLNHPSI